MKKFEPLKLLSPIGRLVQGSLYDPITTDLDNKPIKYKTGKKTGQDAARYYFVVAIKKGTQRYITHLASTPSLIAAARWLEQEKLLGDPHQAVVGKALQAAIKPLGRYRCAACGFETQQHYWQCPGCQTWDSYPPQRVEEL